MSQYSKEKRGRCYVCTFPILCKHCGACSGQRKQLQLTVMSSFWYLHDIAHLQSTHTQFSQIPPTFIPLGHTNRCSSTRYTLRPYHSFFLYKQVSIVPWCFVENLGQHASVHVLDLAYSTRVQKVHGEGAQFSSSFAHV